MTEKIAAPEPIKHAEQSGWRKCPKCAWRPLSIDDYCEEHRVSW